jgi:fructose-1-phosphate kinase PfkB-like protein
VLAAPARLVGPFPGNLGHAATDLLAAEGLDVAPVTVSGELRGTTVVIETAGRTTVINEPGPPLSAGEWDAVTAAVETALEAGAFVAISGSVPPGVGQGAHRQLVEMVHRHRGFVAVDVSGARLVEAATAGADLVSPNLAEAETALGTAAPAAGGEAVDLDGLERAEIEARARAAAAALVGAGASSALVSAGRHGVACRAAEVDTFVPAPAVDVVNPIGAGDSLLGATLVALERGRPFEHAVRDGVTYAAASVAHPVAGYADPGLVAGLTAEHVA